MSFPNRFPGTCVRCHQPVAQAAGQCEKVAGAWQVRCAAECQLAPAPAPRKGAAVGDMAGIMALFGRAAGHLKRPAIELGVPGFPSERAIRVNVATDRAKFPGSLTLLSAARFGNMRRKWFGRILADGTLHVGRELTAEPAYGDAVKARLVAFAADPSRVGAADGLLTGRCCFCRKALTDEKSTAAGYGRKCAENFGLAWGAKPAEFAAAA